MTGWGIDVLFNPSKRHMDDEKQRLQTTREEAGDSSGGRRIDLESGKVTIRRREDGSPTVATAEDEQAEDAQSEDGSAEHESDAAAEDESAEDAAVEPAADPESGATA
jgi:Family of unknown function (DUF6191)